jgi:hypothetical protein
MSVKADLNDYRKALSVNRAEWQAAVDAAHFYLLIDSGVQYGLLETDHEINADRCEQLIIAGEKRGIVPNDVLNIPD